jgi:hypothetical protein
LSPVCTVSDGLVVFWRRRKRGRRRLKEGEYFVGEQYPFVVTVLGRRSCGCFMAPRSQQCSAKRRRETRRIEKVDVDTHGRCGGWNDTILRV